MAGGGGGVGGGGETACYHPKGPILMGEMQQNAYFKNKVQ